MVNVGDVGLIPGLGRASGEENGNPLQYSCLRNSMDRGAWWATVHGGHKRVGHNLATKVLNEAWEKKLGKQSKVLASLKYQSMPSKNALSPCDSLH